MQVCLNGARALLVSGAAAAEIVIVVKASSVVAGLELVPRRRR